MNLQKLCFEDWKKTHEILAFILFDCQFYKKDFTASGSNFLTFDVSSRLKAFIKYKNTSTHTHNTSRIDLQSSILYVSQPLHYFLRFAV